MLQNLHIHTKFCDGDNTVDEFCLRAIELGFDSIGFSSHSPCILSKSETLTDVPAYIKAVREAQEKYAGKLGVFLGVELDALTVDGFPCELFDYSIASVHGATLGEREIYFDYDYEISKKHVTEDFDGDGFAFCELYYKTMLTMPEKIGGDIVGHFDLITKFSEKFPPLFDHDSKRYRTLALDTLHTLRKKYDIFEVNAGPIGRKKLTRPYPAPFILKEMKALECKLVLTTDCHMTERLDVGMDYAREYIKAAGFNEIYYLSRGGFFAERI